MRCRSLLNGLVALLLALSLNPAVAATDTNVLIVDLYLNEQHLGDTFVLVDDQGTFFVNEALLTEWEIRKPWPHAVTFRGTNYYSLGGFVGVDARFDARVMQLDLSLPPALMPERKIDLSWADMAAESEDFGLYLDYQLNWQNYSDAAFDSTYLSLQPVVFGRYGTVSANTVYRHNTGDEVGIENSLQKGLNVLELTYTRDDPENLRSLRIGDVFTGPGAYGRSLRMGGIQFATNFATQPTFVTYPLPRFFGETSVPTALDVYVNGQLRRQTSVEPGSYVLEDMPVVNGFGELQVVTRDALGRQQVFTQDFYASTELLKQGLSDYSISVGALRENYGFANFDYGDFAATGAWRYGYRDDVTLEGHAEVTNGLAVIGAAAKYVIPQGGVLSAGAGISTGRTGTGTRWQVGFRQQIDVLNYSLDVSGASDRYSLVGQLEPPPRLQVFASAGRNFYEYGSLGASVVHREFHHQPRQTIVSANHSKSFRRYITLSTYLSYVDHVEDNFSIGIRFSMPFGDNHYSSAGYSRSYEQDRITAEINRALPLGSGYGYRLATSALDERYIDAGLTLQNDVGTYLVDVRDSEHGGTAWQANITGSLAYLDGMTSFTRQIRDAFAVVNVGNIEGVRVYAENIEIGRTDENGQVFVPGLHPYLRNNLRIAVEDLPLNARVDQLQTQAAPYYKSGVVVNFDVSLSNNVLLRAVLPDGTPVPEGAYATVNRLKKVYPIGQNGKLFLQGIDRSSLITLRWKNLSCDLDVPFPDSTAVIARLGDIVCVPTEDHQ